MERLIVLIDNDVDDLDILDNVIRQVDPCAKCMSFIFADQAVKVLGTELRRCPDYIFVDVNMSRKNGTQCLHELKAVCQENCKIIMLSVFMPTAVGEAFKQLGAYDYFQKPLSESKYKEKIVEILKTC